jgi:hypothetical protein
LDFGTAAVPAGPELSIFIASRVLSYFCCNCVWIELALARVLTAGQDEPCDAPAVMPETVISTVTHLQERSVQKTAGKRLLITERNGSNSSGVQVYGSDTPH